MYAYVSRAAGFAAFSVVRPGRCATAGVRLLLSSGRATGPVARPAADARPMHHQRVVWHGRVGRDRSGRSPCRPAEQARACVSNAEGRRGTECTAPVMCRPWHLRPCSRGAPQALLGSGLEEGLPEAAAGPMTGWHRESTCKPERPIDRRRIVAVYDQLSVTDPDCYLEGCRLFFAGWTGRIIAFSGVIRVFT